MSEHRSHDDSARELVDHIYHALHLVPDDGSGLNKHALWDVAQLTRVIDPEVDLTGMELMAIATILATANERRLSACGGGPATSVPLATEVPPLLRVV